ncbi:lytic transglycosylase domain-containing protein [Nannocystis sp. ILAH1]|uniref:lytic transglycosylase domain-containing protein n=1 Tax=unclassified Nannocystis TaxID=2627009 RepID=UPI002270A926|nr:MULTISPECIES: lytic transglycosylase domain-containing protein [unclassified Nannocystis]MCY0992459.1 lytic transglycosylase domain-containing protein [Nannocystis sp. ILAH1]MCY1068950.1 lytic transglycosylase domain-containing protein [Nannocystis sp. RBIL2]
MAPASHPKRMSALTLCMATTALLACRPAALTPEAERVHRGVNQIPLSARPPTAGTPTPPAAALPPQAPAEVSAAALLARGEPEAALARLAHEPAAAGSLQASVQRLTKARAARELGRPAEAVQALAELAAERRPAKSWPHEVVLHEYAQALVEAAASAPGAEADALRKQAVAAWERAIDHEPVRNAAPMRVARARTMAAIEGQAAARRAVKALTEVLRDYPEHPDAAGLELLRAQAIAREGKTADAVKALRTVAIWRAGTEAAVGAEAALAELGRPVRYSAAEQLDRAAAARRSRDMTLSRRVLTDLVEDSKTPGHVREVALRSRASTASRAHDYGACADDLSVLSKKSASADLRGDLLRCLDKAGRYDEALAIWTEQAGRKGGAGRAALWEAIRQAVRGGRYEKARELLGRTQAKERQRGEGLWLDAWLDFRLGDFDAAATAFASAERRLPADQARAARYFRARALLAAGTGAKATGDAGEEQTPDRGEAERLLRQLVAEDPLGYYGLQARQRLLDIGADPGPLPALAPVPAESNAPPDFAATRATFEALAGEFGWAFPALARGAALHAAGLLDEARRELRVAVDAYEGLYGLDRGGWVPRHEDLVVGLSWKSTWKQPRLGLPKDARKLVRERGAGETLREGLFALTWALDEPYRRSRLMPATAGSYKARWHPRAFREAVEREATARAFDPTHLWALMYTESRFRRHVVSSSGARGAIQIMPWTGQQLAARLGESFDVDALFDEEHNVRLSAYYFAELLHKFHGQAALAYASYNGGPFNVARWLAAKGSTSAPLELDVFIAEIPFRETANYTRRVLEVQAAYALMYGGSLPRWQNTVDLRVEDNIDF